MASLIAKLTSTNEKVKDLQNDTVEIKKGKLEAMTTAMGAKVDNTDTWIRAGARGPASIEDTHGREKITKFDHERIPERVVHARGTAAHGEFTLHTPLTGITSAPVLLDTSRATPVFVRFSTVLGFRGSADTVRDVRGFATRFFTQEGNWDLVGNNIPVFFVQDGIKFPDVIHAGKPEPHNEIPQAQTAHDNFWDFVSLTPETTHMIMWLLSDRAIPRSFRHMEGFGVHSFLLVNEEGKRTFVKFHWIPHQGLHSLVWDECQKLQGYDADFHRRDLYDAIEAGAYPKWDLAVQIVPEENAEQFDFDLLDVTKIIPEELVPLQKIGVMELNKNPTEFFSEVEQVAFCTQNILPGMDFSNDPMLQIRNFSYQDTQISRIGVNFHQLPINRPICPIATLLRDGKMNMEIKKGPNYWPNRFGVPHPVPPPEGSTTGQPTKVEGVRGRQRPPKFDEHFSQATLFWNSLSDVEKDHFMAAAQFEVGKCSDRGVQERMIARFNEVDHTLATTVAANFDIPVSAPKKYHDKKTNVSMRSDTNRYVPAGRRIGLFAFDGVDGHQLHAFKKSLEAAGNIVNTIGTRKGPIYPRSVQVGNRDDPLVLFDSDFTIDTSRSVLFDAVIYPSGDEKYEKALNTGRCIVFAREAYGHFKPIAAVGVSTPWFMHTVLPGSLDIKADPAKPFTEKNGVVLSHHDMVSDQEGIVNNLKGLKNGAEFEKAFTDACALHRHFSRDITKIAF